MRKLASVQIVSEIKSIDGADAIEKIRVLGWWVVTKKGEYSVGDRVVYCEVDSLLPERDEFEFLRKNCFKPELAEHGDVIRPAGFRIKTIKLRKQVSQGICFPLSILPDEVEPELDRDVSEELGITKFELPTPANMKGRVKGPFPGFLSKTDETRVQILEDVLERHRGTEFVTTEKLDGSSFTAFLNDGEFGICSRNLWLDETDSSNDLARFAEKLDLLSKLESMRSKLGFDVALQGEMIGPGIQKNKYRLESVDLRVFNVFNISTYRYVDHGEFTEVISTVGLETVPILGTFALNHTIDELVEQSIGHSVLNRQTRREGLVFRPLSETYDETLGGRLSFKVINPKFLLKYDE